MDLGKDNPQEPETPDGSDTAELSALIRDHAIRYRAEPMLAASIRAELAMQAAHNEQAERAQRGEQDQEADRVESPPAPSPPQAPRPRWSVGWWLGAGVAIGALASVILLTGLQVAGVATGAGGAGRVLQSTASRQLASNGVTNELVVNHLRSLMVSHLNDVASSDQHQVKPWFQGKLDYAPPVPDFKADGFALEGGRLDFLEGRAVAALVYRRGQQVINVFVRPAEPGSTLPAALRDGTRQRGVNLLGWDDAGMQYLAATDANPADLVTLSRLWRRGGG